MQIIMGTLEGLAAVHSVNLVHRDMKPDNVIMHDRGDGSKIPKIVDFGMAKGLRAPDGTALASQKLFMTEENMVAGSPEYMSPEQWAGIEKDIDFRSDIWAVGATLFQLLSGKPPYEAPPGQVILPILSLFTRFRPYLAHFFPVFSRFLRVFPVWPRRFQRAPSRNPGPRNSRQEYQERRTPPFIRHRRC